MSSGADVTQAVRALLKCVFSEASCPPSGVLEPGPSLRVCLRPELPSSLSLRVEDRARTVRESLAMAVRGLRSVA